MRNINFTYWYIIVLFLFCFSSTNFPATVAYGEEKKITIDQVLEICTNKDLSDIQKIEGQKITMLVEVYSIRDKGDYYEKSPYFVSSYCDSKKEKGCMMMRFVLADDQLYTIDNLRKGQLLQGTCSIKSVRESARYMMLENCIIDKMIVGVNTENQ